MLGRAILVMRGCTQDPGRLSSPLMMSLEYWETWFGDSSVKPVRYSSTGLLRLQYVVVLHYVGYSPSLAGLFCSGNGGEMFYN